MKFWENRILGKWELGTMGFGDNEIWGKCDDMKMDQGILDLGKQDFGKWIKGLRENGR